jgi:hypothetical protein
MEATQTEVKRQFQKLTHAMADEIAALIELDKATGGLYKDELGDWHLADNIEQQIRQLRMFQEKFNGQHPRSAN